MYEFVLDVDKNELVIVMHAPSIPEPTYKTTVCIVPDPCPGCGNCLLCDSKCTCSVPAVTA